MSATTTNPGLTTNDIVELIAAVADKAPELRAAGVTRLSVGGVDVEISPDSSRALQEAIAAAGGARNEHIDPLMDPVTYGRADGRVPAFRRVAEFDEAGQ